MFAWAIELKSSWNHGFLEDEPKFLGKIPMVPWEMGPSSQGTMVPNSNCPK
jgi:hypothetical protein